MENKLFNFVGSLVVIIIALGIFLILMSNSIPNENRELIIAFVSALFGAIASSIKNITGGGEN